MYRMEDIQIDDKENLLGKIAVLLSGRRTQERDMRNLKLIVRNLHRGIHDSHND